MSQGPLPMPEGSHKLHACIRALCRWGEGKRSSAGGGGNIKSYAVDQEGIVHNSTYLKSHKKMEGGR